MCGVITRTNGAYRTDVGDGGSSSNVTNSTNTRLRCRRHSCSDERCRRRRRRLRELVVSTINVDECTTVPSHHMSSSSASPSSSDASSSDDDTPRRSRRHVTTATGVNAETSDTHNVHPHHSQRRRHRRHRRRRRDGGVAAVAPLSTDPSLESGTARVMSGRHAVRLNIAQIHQAFMEAMHVESVPWSRRNLTVAVDYDQAPHVDVSASARGVTVSLERTPPSAPTTSVSLISSVVSGLKRVAATSPPLPAATDSNGGTLREYNFYAGALPCASFDANPLCFPFVPMMGTDLQSSVFRAPAPLVSLRDIGGGCDAMQRLNANAFRAVWATVFAHNARELSVRHLRVIGVRLEVCTDNVTVEQRRRQCFHTEIDIQLVAERRAPSRRHVTLHELSGRGAVYRERMRGNDDVEYDDVDESSDDAV